MIQSMPSQSTPWATWLGERMAYLGFATNSDLARAAGIPDSVISRWRTAGTTPLVEQLRRLSVPLQAPMLELLVAAGYLSSEEAEVTEFAEPVRRPKDAREAIGMDEELPPDLKHLLLAQYDAMLAVARARQGETVGAGAYADH